MLCLNTIETMTACSIGESCTTTGDMMVQFLKMTKRRAHSSPLNPETPVEIPAETPAEIPAGIPVGIPVGIPAENPTTRRTKRRKRRRRRTDCRPKAFRDLAKTKLIREEVLWYLLTIF